MKALEQQVAAAREWFASARFAGIVRLYSARNVAEQQGTIATDSGLARTAAEAFYARLRELFAQRKQITTFGPSSPGQAVVIKRMGIEGIYLGGWATSAKGSPSEDPGPDLASYPLSQSTRRSGWPCPRLADRRQESALCAAAHVRRTAQGDAGRRLSAVHHR